MTHINPGLYGHDSAAVQSQLHRMEHETIAQSRAGSSMADAFIDAMMAGDMEAPAYFAQKFGKGFYTVGEAAEMSLDYGPANPATADLVALLAKAAKGADIAREAASMLSRMADVFTSHNAEAAAMTHEEAIRKSAVSHQRQSASVYDADLNHLTLLAGEPKGPNGWIGLIAMWAVALATLLIVLSGCSAPSAQQEAEDVADDAATAQMQDAIDRACHGKTDAEGLRCALDTLQRLQPDRWISEDAARAALAVPYATTTNEE